VRGEKKQAKKKAKAKKAKAKKNREGGGSFKANREDTYLASSRGLSNIQTQ
jgi:hypothetical protein